MISAIGGYFELADFEEGVFPHSEGILLNTGRNALEYILLSLGDVERLFLPYYTCEAVLEPIKKLNISWSFYHINSFFEIAEDITPKSGEYVVVNNYFGIKDSYIQSLIPLFGEHLIVDCAQAFFYKPKVNINVFYSARKFVGVADGGIAYIKKKKNEEPLIKDSKVIVNYGEHLFIRKHFGAEAGFSKYRENEEKLRNQPIRLMSDTTKGLLNHIDYDNVVQKRRTNYMYLHRSLKDINNLQLPSIDSFSCPMVYPLYIGSNTVKEELIMNRVYVASYWPNVLDWCTVKDWEYHLANDTIFLPVDQRYGIIEMGTIINLLLDNIDK